MSLRHHYDSKGDSTAASTCFAARTKTALGTRRRGLPRMVKISSAPCRTISTYNRWDDEDSSLVVGSPPRRSAFDAQLYLDIRTPQLRYQRPRNHILGSVPSIRSLSRLHSDENEGVNGQGHQGEEQFPFEDCMVPSSEHSASPSSNEDGVFALEVSHAEEESHINHHLEPPLSRGSGGSSSSRPAFNNAFSGDNTALSMIGRMRVCRSKPIPIPGR